MWNAVLAWGNRARPYPMATSAQTLVTTSDVTPSDGPFRGLYVGGEGDVVVRLYEDDTDVTFKAVPAGTVLPVLVKAVRSTTTATHVVGLL